jgi:lipopolysaccharide/colanic/teichoic acid biosynthesis glycosyltransferase
MERQTEKPMYKRYIKRLLDVVLSGLALLVLSPLLLVVTVWLHYANHGAGAFFTQERPGRYGKIFRIYKYKTMTDERDAEGVLLPDAQRLTPVGRFVRSTSIDELPQLWNVLTGDMSLIGPRPLLKNFLYLYDKKQMHRHDVSPGITGWAQVNGRNLCTYSKKFEYDLWYVNHISFTLDLKIILMTISNVLRRDDIGEGSVNNEEVDDLQFTERLEAMGLREE